MVGLLGLISIVAGVLALAFPDITLLALGLIVGINLVLIGAVWVALATTEERQSAGGGVLRMLVGFLAVLAGLVCLVRPGAGVLALLIAVSFWFIITGMADLARAMEEHEHRIIAGTLGVIGIAAGVIIVANPDIGLTTLALLAGICFIVAARSRSWPRSTCTGWRTSGIRGGPAAAGPPRPEPQTPARSSSPKTMIP